MKSTGRIKQWLVAAAGLACLALAGPALADSTSTSGGLILVTVNTARNVGLSGACGTLDDDPGAVFYNPAGLYSLKRIKGFFTHQGGLAEDYTEVLNCAAPWETVGVVGATLVYHGMPALNDAGGDVPAVNVSDKLGIVSFARSADDLLSGLAYGVNFKFLNSILGAYSANALAVDLGVLWDFMPAATLGLTVRNLGTPLKFIEDADPLPLRAGLSGKYKLLAGSQEDWFVAADVEQTMESATNFHLGTEFVYAKTFSGRLGYTASPGNIEGISFGLGVQTAISAYSVRLEYAYRVMTWSEENFDGLQLFTVGLIY